MDLDSSLDNFYNTLLTEHNRLMNEMRNVDDNFTVNSNLQTHISTLMRNILKLKAYKQKILR